MFPSHTYRPAVDSLIIVSRKWTCCYQTDIAEWQKSIISELSGGKAACLKSTKGGHSGLHSVFTIADIENPAKLAA